MAFLRDRSVVCLNFTDTSGTFFNKNLYSSICISTATFGLIGAAIQLKAWRKVLPLCEIRKRPSPNPHAIFCLALSDLGACLGVIILSALFFIVPEPEKCRYNGEYRCPSDDLSHNFIHTVTLVESLTQFFYLATYMWTFCYALDVYFQVQKIYCHTVVYHIVSWGIPFVFVLMVLLSIIFFTVPGTNGENINLVCTEDSTLKFRYMVSYIPVLVTAVFMVIFYALSIKKIRSNVTKYGCYSRNERQLLKAVRKKFSAIIGFFLLCWMPNIVEFFSLSFKMDLDLREMRFFILWIIEALLNPLQGFFNCLLYGQHKFIRNNHDQSFYQNFDSVSYDSQVDKNVNQAERFEDITNVIADADTGQSYDEFNDRDNKSVSVPTRSKITEDEDDQHSPLLEGIIGSLPRGSGSFRRKLLGDPNR